MAKTAKQLDAEIDEALQERERLEMNKELGRLSPREQEIVLRSQEIGAFGDLLKAAGLQIKHSGRGKYGQIVVSGKPTYKLRDVLKKYGFRFDGQSKQWLRPTDYSKRPGDIDYLSFYNDLVKGL